MAEYPRRTEWIVSHVCLDDLDGPRRFSRALKRQSESPISEIGVQSNGLLELGHGLFMPALEGQNHSKAGMSDREIRVDPNRLPSERMRTFECRRAQMILI